MRTVLVTYTRSELTLGILLVLKCAVRLCDRFAGLVMRFLKETTLLPSKRRPSPKGHSSPLQHTFKLLQTHSTDILAFPTYSAICLEDHISQDFIRYVLS